MNPSKNTKKSNSKKDPDSTITLALANILLVMAASLGFLVASVEKGSTKGGEVLEAIYPGLENLEITSRSFDREKYDKKFDTDISNQKKDSNKKEQQIADGKFVVFRVAEYEGITPYVWAGETPRGWDCSGLVVWAYRQIGVAVPHNSTALKSAGKVVTNPREGDVVIFGWKGKSRAQHAGLYVSEDVMIHSGGRSGYRTEYESISRWATMNGNTSTLYIRVLKD